MPLKWGVDDNKDAMLGRALSYLVLFSTLGIIVRWSFGVRLLTSAEEEIEESDREEQLVTDSLSDSEREESEDEEDRREAESRALLKKDTLTFLGEPPAPKLVRRNSITLNLDSDSASRASSLGATPTQPTSTESTSKRTPTTAPALNHANSILRRHTRKSTSQQRDQQASKRISLPPASDAVCVAPLDHQHQHSRAKHSTRSKRPQSIFQSFPNTPMASRGASEYSFSEAEDEYTGEREWGMARGTGRREEDEPETWVGEQWRRGKMRGHKFWRIIRRLAKRIDSFVRHLYNVPCNSWRAVKANTVFIRL